MLVWVFGGVAAALLPLIVGLMAILGAMSVLRLITTFSEVSIFALNITSALGLALAIDYTLLIVSRYRDESEVVQPRKPPGDHDVHCGTHRAVLGDDRGAVAVGAVGLPDVLPQIVRLLGSRPSRSPPPPLWSSPRPPSL